MKHIKLLGVQAKIDKYTLLLYVMYVFTNVFRTGLLQASVIEGRH